MNIRVPSYNVSTSFFRNETVLSYIYQVYYFEIYGCYFVVIISILNRNRLKISENIKISVNTCRSKILRLSH